MLLPVEPAMKAAPFPVELKVLTCMYPLADVSTVPEATVLVIVPEKLGAAVTATVGAEAVPPITMLVLPAATDVTHEVLEVSCLDALAPTHVLAVSPLSMKFAPVAVPVHVGVLVSVIVGVEPPVEVMLPETVIEVIHDVLEASCLDALEPTQVLAVRPLSMTCPAVAVPVQVGALVSATEGVAPVPTTMFEPAVRPVTVPQAAAAEDSNPPVVACTQLPEVNPVAVSVAADNPPVKVGAFVIDTVGVSPPVEEIFPVPETEVTGEVTRAALGTVPAVRPDPEPLNDRADTAPVNVGAFVTATEGVAPVPTKMFDPAVRPVTVPEPVPHAPEAVVSCPPVVVCTHKPEDRPEALIVGTTREFKIEALPEVSNSNRYWLPSVTFKMLPVTPRGPAVLVEVKLV